MLGVGADDKDDGKDEVAMLLSEDSAVELD